MRAKAMATCKFCGTSDLLWAQAPASGKWFLTTNEGDFHDCPKRTHPVDARLLDAAGDRKRLRVVFGAVDGCGKDDLVQVIHYAVNRLVRCNWNDAAPTDGCGGAEDSVPGVEGSDALRGGGLVRVRQGAAEAAVPEPDESMLPF